MRAVVLAASALMLAGCAASQGPIDDADCRHVITHAGKPLRMCESNGLLTIDDRPPHPADPSDKRLIDDPAFIRGMVAQIEAKEGGAAPALRSAPTGYITIADSDFVTLVRGAFQRWFAASSTGSKAFYPR